jgi:basic membrane protein A
VVDERSGPPGDKRVALVIPRPLEAGSTNAITLDLVDGLRAAEREYGIQSKVFVADEFDVDNPGTQTTLAGLRRGDFDLAILFSRAMSETLLPAIVEAKSTRFVVIDASVAQVGGRSNVTGLLFRNEQSGYLVGYLSGLMEAERGARLNEARVVSSIGGFRDLPAVEQFMGGFGRGARVALPGVRILTGYTQEFLDQSKCEELANRHIDAGADIVFAAAGECSLGALRAAGIRGVWGVGVDGDRSSLGNHILASAVKRFDEAVLVAVRSLSQGTLRGGRDIVLGIEDDAVGIAGISPEVPQSIRRKVARAAAQLSRTSKG